MSERRRIRNSQFDNVLENFDVFSGFGTAVPEKGAIVYSEGRVYYGDGVEFLQLANSTDLPTGNLGYQFVTDGEHTNVDNAQNITAVAQIILNNSATSKGTLTEFNSNKFYLRDEVMYIITISFTAQVSANNQHAQLFFGYSGLPANGYSDVLPFVKGNNVAHAFSRTYQILGDASTESDGISLYLFPSHAGKLWGSQFTIQRAF